MQIITAAVIKGGTGKTTTAAALLQAAALDGRKALGVDLDPQSNLTSLLSADPNAPGARDLLHGAAAPEVIQQTGQGIDCIAGCPDLAAEKTATGSASRLMRALEPIRAGYDLIVIDTPPQMGELTFNALQAATGLIIPLEADNSSIQGLYQITDIARQIGRSNRDLEILGTVVTRYDARPKLNRYFLEAIKEAGAAAGAPFLMAIRPAIAVKEAQAMQQSLFTYAPGSRAAADYLALYQKITRKEG